MDYQDRGHTRCHSSFPLPSPPPPPPLPAVAPQTMNNKFGIKMLRHEDRKQLP